MFDELLRKISDRVLESKELQAALRVAETSDLSEWKRTKPIWTSNTWYTHSDSGIEVSTECIEDFRDRVHWAKINDHRFTWNEGKRLFNLIHKRSEDVRSDLRRELQAFAADLPSTIERSVQNVRQLSAPEAEEVVRANFKLWPTMFYSKDTLLVVKGSSDPYTVIGYLDRHPLWRGQKECVVLGPNFQQSPESETLSGPIAGGIVEKLCTMAGIKVSAV